ncbi:MAG: outer membrane protein transport protein [Sedimenticola sp.]
MNRSHKYALNPLAVACGIALLTTGQAHAGGYKIPEQSVNSTALSAAYVANAQGPDSSYYNPAAMVFNEGGRALEVDGSLIHLTRISASGDFTDRSQVENFLVPTFHYMSDDNDGLRYGLSVVVPGGLTKRWEGTAAAFAEEFTLKTLEFNPTIGYKLSDSFSVGGGVRAIFSKGKVVSSGTALATIPPNYSGGRYLTGDSWDFGYNLAAHFKPSDNLDLSATYRSEINLSVEGNAELSYGGTLQYNGGASVMVPIPAALNLAAAYTFDRTTLELVLERTYWSGYKNLDFEYASSTLSSNPGVNAVLLALFDAPKTKNWQDSDTIRIGLTHEMDDRWTLMAGFAYDETPVPKKYAGYELPDSDAKIYSIGARYKYSDDFTVGAAFLYDDKESLDLAGSGNTTNLSTLTPAGTFKNAAAYFITVGLEYRF